MKKNTKDLLKMGVIIPALILSLAACGASGNNTTAEPAAEETEAEATETETETTEEVVEETAAEPITYENDGMKMTVPAEFADKVIVETIESKEDGILFTVSEKASVEAGKAQGDDFDGYGWLFAIGTIDDETRRQSLCNDMSGQIIFAEDEAGNYYVYYHPTDVRYNRETPEQMEADQDDWTAVCEWADTMRDAFIQENSGLTAKSYDNSDVAMALARTAYEEGLKYTISTTEFGPLEPNGVDAEPYFERLVCGAKYEYTDEEAPDGEYVVLMFEDDGVRYDFFYADGYQNYVRRVYGDAEDDYTLYKATLADETATANGIMDEWYHALAEKK